MGYVLSEINHTKVKQKSPNNKIFKMSTKRFNDFINVIFSQSHIHYFSQIVFFIFLRNENTKSALDMSFLEYKKIFIKTTYHLLQNASEWHFFLRFQVYYTGNQYCLLKAILAYYPINVLKLQF